jgi:hypothetical protein
MVSLNSRGEVEGVSSNRECVVATSESKRGAKSEFKSTIMTVSMMQW